MRRAAWLLGLAAVAAMGLPGCSKSKSASSTAPTVTPASGTVPGPEGASTFTVEIQDVEAVNAPAEFPDAVRAGVQLSPEGDGWKVSAYDVRVTRDTSGVAPTTHVSRP